MVLRGSLFIFLLTALVSCTSTSSVEKSETGSVSLEEKPFSEDDAKGLFSLRCASCHGTDGTLGMSGAKDLSASKLSDSEIITIIQKGKNAMPAFDGIIPAEQQEPLVSVVKSLRKK